MSYIYNVFITALVPNYQDHIVAALTKKGYMVGPASSDGKVIADGASAGALFALSVYKADDTIDTHKIHEDVANILQEVKACTYSLVVALASDVSWSGSNFDIPSPSTSPIKKSIVN